MHNTQQVWEWIGRNLWQLIIVGSLFIQISPIKINPWSAILKWIGKTITGDACSKIDVLISRVDNIEKNVIENEKDRIRWEILDFDNSCHNEKKHTKDEFEHIVTLNKKYKNLLKESNDENGVFEAEYEYIQDLYKERLEKNDFLK